MKSILIFITLNFLVLNAVYAQDSISCQKVGIARLNYIIMKMPEMKEIEAQMKEFKDQLSKMYQLKVEDYDKKYFHLTSLSDSIPNFVRTSMEQELISLQRSIVDFEEQAKVSIVQRENSLLQPIQIRVFNSIQEVANDLNFSLIINSETGSVPLTLFHRDHMDISDIVLSRLSESEE